MSKRSLHIAKASGLKIRQRIALSLLARSYPDFTPGTDKTWHTDFAKYLDKNEIEIFGKLKSRDELAKFLRDAFGNEFELQPRQIKAIVKSHPHLNFLSGFENIRATAIKNSIPDCFLTSLTLGALALDWDPQDRRLWFRNDKRRSAIAVLKREWARWEPKRNRWADLAGLPLAFLTPQHVKSISSSHALIAQRAADPNYVDRNFAPISFKVSPNVAKQFPAHPAEEFTAESGHQLLDYLMQLAFDEEPLHPAVHLRWALSVCACTAALQALTVCEWEDRDVKENERSRADALLGIAKIFWGNSGAEDWALTIRAVNRLSLPNGDEKLLRALWGMATLRTATTKLHDVFRTLTIEPQWIWDSWTAHPDPDPKLPKRSLHPGTARLWRTVNWPGRMLSSANGTRWALNFRNGMFRRKAKPETPQTDSSPAHDATLLSDAQVARVKLILVLCAKGAHRVIKGAQNANRALERKDYEKLLNVCSKGNRVMERNQKASKRRRPRSNVISSGDDVAMQVAPVELAPGKHS